LPKAKFFARKSVELRERVSESDDPALAADLAALLDGQEKFDESEPLYLHALAIFRRAHGEEHYEIAVNLHNLAGVYQAQERLAEAETHYLRALAVKEKIFPSDNVEIALTLNNLGALYQTLSRDDEAAPLLQRALAIFEQSLEAGHPHLIACRENYAAFSS
jgi:tetratricopeptide (TPR) repeat protein